MELDNNGSEEDNLFKVLSSVVTEECKEARDNILKCVSTYCFIGLTIECLAIAAIVVGLKFTVGYPYDVIGAVVYALFLAKRNHDLKYDIMASKMLERFKSLLLKEETQKRLSDAIASKIKEKAESTTLPEDDKEG